MESSFIKRSYEMGNELVKIAEEKGEDRAVMLVAMDQLGGVEVAEFNLSAYGQGYTLLRLCQTMWNNPQIGPALRALVVSEIDKIRQSDESE